MIDPNGTLLAFVQILLLAFTAFGWGVWIESLAGGKSRARMADQALCILAGWAAFPLLLENLVYLGVRVAWSAWLGLGVAGAGWIAFIFRRPPSERRNWMVGLAAPGTVALLVIVFQGAGLWTSGAHNYYGNAHEDQVNYVQLAEFLVEKPFNSTLSDVGLEPWMIKGINTKEMRIGQSVANAYLEVISLTDAKSAYGAVSIFSLGLMAMAVFCLLRNLGLSPLQSALAAIWAGVLPVITLTHLDGFFSQTFVLCVLPALANSTLIAGRNARLSWLTGGLLLAYLLNGYTELFVIGVAIIAAGLLARIEIAFMRRVLVGVGILSLALLVVPAYSVRFATFVGHQYRVAATPEALADLAPRSGTWGGWSELFFPSGVTAAQPVPLFAMIAGFGVFALALTGLASIQPGRRLWLTLVGAVPAGLCAALLSLPAFSKYPFAKLLASFSPLFAAFAVLGIWRSVPLLFTVPRRHPRLMPPKLSRWMISTGVSISFVLIAASGWGSYQLLLSVVHNEGILTFVNSPEIRAVYRELESHPGGTYLLNEQHNIVNAWLAYHARHSRVYADVDFIGDSPTPSSQFAFRHPPIDQDIALVNHNGIKSVRLSHGKPDILVRNPQGIEGSQNLTFYWIGDEAGIEFFTFSQKSENFIFSLRGLAGPANPSPHRVVTLIPKEFPKNASIRSFDTDARLSFPLQLHPGRNIFTFKVIEPTEWLVHVPGDPRKHMVRIQELDLSPLAGPN